MAHSDPRFVSDDPRYAGPPDENNNDMTVPNVHLLTSLATLGWSEWLKALVVVRTD